MTPRLRELLILVLGSVMAAQAHPQEPIVRMIAMPRDAKDAFSRSVSVVRPLDDALLRDWRAAKEQAREAGVQVLILEVTATGGRKHVLTAMAEDFADLRASGVKIVAFVSEKATGPAALLALEADTLVLSSEARVGAADPELMEGTAGTGPGLQSELLKQATASARRNGHPVVFVESMIDPAVEIYEVRRTGQPPQFVGAAEIEGVPKEGVSRELVVRRGETLTMTAVDAIRFGFPIKMAESRDGLLRALGLEDRSLASSEVIEIRGRDTGGAGWFHFDWTLVFLALGILFLVLELKTPGLGINGILGIAALAAYFLLNAGSGGVDAAITIGLLMVGFLLLLVEVVFIPGFGVPGILGILMILLSIYAASIGLPGDTLREQLIPDSDADFLRLRSWLINFLGSLVAGSLGALLIAPRLHRLPLLNRAFLTPALARAGQSMSAAPPRSGVSAEGWVPLDVGAHGVSETDLRPSGLARIRDHRIDVVTDGEYIAKGTRIVVAAIEGHRVVVRPDDRPAGS